MEASSLPDFITHVCSDYDGGDISIVTTEETNPGEFQTALKHAQEEAFRSLFETFINAQLSEALSVYRVTATTGVFSHEEPLKSTQFAVHLDLILCAESVH